MRVLLLVVFLLGYEISFAQTGAEAKNPPKTEDPSARKEETSAHTSPEGDKLTPDMKPCKDDQCNQHSMSASRRDDDNCMMGSNLYNTEACGRGAGRTQSSGGDGQEGTN